MAELPAPWVVAEKPPSWLMVSDSELARVRTWLKRLKVWTVHLSGDVITLDGGAEFATVDRTNANPELAAIECALRKLDTKRVREEEENRDRGAEASERLRKQFGKGYTQEDPLPPEQK